jgi:hypothetical protein
MYAYAFIQTYSHSIDHASSKDYDDNTPNAAPNNDQPASPDASEGDSDTRLINSAISSGKTNFLDTV